MLKNIWFKWTSAVQTCIVQRSPVHIPPPTPSPPTADLTYLDEVWESLLLPASLLYSNKLCILLGKYVETCPVLIRELVASSFKNKQQPWPVWLSWQGVIPLLKRLLVPFWIRAHAGVVSSNCGRVCSRGSRWMFHYQCYFLPLLSSLSLFLKINVKISESL